MMELELECFLNAIGMAKNMIARIFLSLDQQMMDFAALLTP